MIRSRSATIALLACLGGLVAAGPRHPDIVVAAQAVALTPDPAWKQIRTGHVAVVSDADEAVMRKAAGELEGFRRAIQQLAPSWRTTSALPTRLVLFKDQRSFDAFRPRDANGRKRELVLGYFTERPHVTYMVTFVQRVNDSTSPRSCTSTRTSSSRETCAGCRHGSMKASPSSIRPSRPGRMALRLSAVCLQDACRRCGAAARCSSKSCSGLIRPRGWHALRRRRRRSTRSRGHSCIT